MKKILNNEKGFTLIELLAVIVILGIIAAIAVPSISGIIDNSKKDAHIANAQSMIDATKYAVAADSKLLPTSDGDSVYFTLEWLEDNGYIEELIDPDGGSYARETDLAADGGQEEADAIEPKEINPTTKADITPPTLDNVSYVIVTKAAGTSTDKYEYKVYLAGSERTVEDVDNASEVAEASLAREKVEDN